MVLARRKYMWQKKKTTLDPKQTGCNIERHLLLTVPSSPYLSSSNYPESCIWNYSLELP